MATVGGLLGDGALMLLFALQAISLPLFICWALARFAMDVSLTYAVQCTYLELRVSLRYWFPPKEPDAELGAASAAAGSRRPAPPDLSEAQRGLPLRGVLPPSSAAAYAASTGGQGLPPTKRVAALLGGKEPPEGERLPYPEPSSSSSSSWRSSAASPLLGRWHSGRAPKEEASLGAEEDEAWRHRAKCLREGAEVHRQVRQYVQQKVRPGMELRELADMVDQAASSLVGFDPKNPLKRGQAFPVGLSLNEFAAHDTVNPGDPPRWLLPTDLVKLDFGVHVEGHILDCAFSFAFDEMHDELMQAVRDATNEGIRRAGPDALVAEIGGYIREVMETAEVHRPDGKVLPVYSIKNLTGHNIAPYHIHSGKSLPSVNCGGRTRMLAGELWAIETFGSAGGLGYVVNRDNCSHFMRPSSAPPSRMAAAALSDSAKAMLELIDRRFGTLAFCPRWVVQEAATCKSKHLRPPPGGDAARWWTGPLQELCNIGVVNRYPPLADLPGCYTAQYEHTVLLREGCKEVLTRGSDY